MILQNLVNGESFPEVPLPSDVAAGGSLVNGVKRGLEEDEDGRDGKRGRFKVCWASRASVRADVVAFSFEPPPFLVGEALSALSPSFFMWEVQLLPIVIVAVPFARNPDAIR
jgi:hypothetical protein